jgi:hypothetical protein
MNTNRRAAIFVGIMFICATVSAILGLFVFYPPILTGTDYLITGAAHANQVVLGALMELVTACTAIGTAIGLFPVLRPYGERIALGHLLFRFLEAVVITIGIDSVLSLLTLSQGLCGSGDSGCVRVSRIRHPAPGGVQVGLYAWPAVLPGHQHVHV